MPSPISFSYDAASRVISEALNGEWSNTYGYDKAGNRTSVNDGTISRTIGYGTGNREISVSDNIDPLEYDFLRVFVFVAFRVFFREFRDLHFLFQFQDVLRRFAFLRV